MTRRRSPARRNVSLSDAVSVRRFRWYHSAGIEPELAALFAPVQRQIFVHEHAFRGQLDRIPSIKNGFDDVGRWESEPQDTADIGAGHALGLGDVADRGRIAIL